MDEERVSEIIPWMAITILANGYGSVNNAVLVRNLEFKLKMKISLVSVIFGSFFGVLFCYLVSSLVGLVVLFTAPPVLLTVGLWVFAPYGFEKHFKPKLIYSDLPYIFKVAVSSFLEQGSKAFLTFLLNAKFGVSDLGLYSRADAIKNLSSQTLDKVVQRVSFPTLARENYKGQASLVLEHINISVTFLFLLTPIAYIVSSFSDVLIILFYGRSWGDSGLILEQLIYMGLFMP